jgi:nucleoid DNA-binding protein
MKIDQFISQLLYRYQCVTVPGFGAFLTEIRSAQLHQNTHSFYPPRKVVSFNAYLKNNDGLLANHIAQSEKIPYESATALIENQVNEWKNSLNELGKISIKNVGDITLNSENNLVFIPTEQTNYLTSSFGLSSFVSPAVKREVIKEIFNPEIESVDEIKALEEETPIVLLQEERNSSPFLKYAAVFVLGAGLLAGGYFGNNFYQNQIQQETLAVETKVQKQVEQEIQKATFIIANPLPSVSLSSANGKMPYHIVAGAFRQEENAVKMYDELVKLGYDAKRIPKNSHDLFPVLYGSYTSLIDAQAELDKIKSHNQEAWILIQEF